MATKMAGRGRGQARPQVKTQRAFRKDGHDLLMRIVIIQSAAIVALAIALLFSVFFIQPKREYFAMTPQGRIVPLIALDQPNLTQSALIGWLVQAATETMTFGFNDVDRRLAFSLRHFTERGRESFLTAVNDAGLLTNVVDNRQLITAAPQEAPVVVEEGVDPRTGRYRWVLEFPMAMTVQSGARSTSSDFRVTVVVVRVPTDENAMGVGIDQWVTGSRSG